MTLDEQSRTALAQFGVTGAMIVGVAFAIYAASARKSVRDRIRGRVVFWCVTVGSVGTGLAYLLTKPLWYFDEVTGLMAIGLTAGVVIGLAAGTVLADRLAPQLAETPRPSDDS